MSTEVLQRHLASIARLAPLIEAHADSAEQLRRLPPPVVRALVEAGLFKLYLPRSLGGSELEPLEFAECLEAISRIDGSAGWCVFLGNVNTLFTSPMVPESIEAIFANQKATKVEGPAPGSWSERMIQKRTKSAVDATQDDDSEES